MSTPYIALTKLLRLALVCAMAVWGGAFCIVNIYRFHMAFTMHRSKVKDEEWLLKQCHNPDFFYRLKAHTDICDELHANAARNAVLFALNHVVGNMHMCGGMACTALFTDLIKNLGWQAVALVGVVLLVLGNTLIVLLRHYLHGQVARREQRFLRGQYRMELGDSGMMRYPMLYDDDDEGTCMLRKRGSVKRLTVEEGGGSQGTGGMIGY